jgi:DNA-binding Lrp family transcriptional regulator
MSMWQDGQRAWERLQGWPQERPGMSGGHPDDGDAALGALSDVGLVRRLLDEAELEAVRTARGHVKSWAEIAIKLGVTRQSAWERWRDLDERVVDERAVDERAVDERGVDKRSSGGGEALDAAVAEVEVAITSGAGHRARTTMVLVPDVIGLTWEAARQVLDRVRLVPIILDSKGVPLPAHEVTGSVVRDQRPKGGDSLPANSEVAIWLRNGGGPAGVREPRQPKPPLRSAGAMRDEVSGETVV